MRPDVDLDDDVGFDSGVIVRIKDEYKVTSLPDTVGVNPSLLNAPIYVLHPTAARKLDVIEVQWVKKIKGVEVQKTFRFLRSASTPFPTVTHAKYLDILLSMFSQNWNSEGILHFRYNDVQRIAGNAESSRARESIQQTILRYHRHITEWENCWNGRNDRLTFNIIEKSSIFDSRGILMKHSPGRSKVKEKWHTVVFHKEIVKALKDEKKRILLTDIFKQLDQGAFGVYRYFYGHPDNYVDGKGAPHDHYIWRNIEFLQSIFKWTGQKNRFIPWFKKRLLELEVLNLISKPIWNSDAVGVHCKNIKEIKLKKAINLVSEHKNPQNLILENGQIIDTEFQLNGSVNNPTNKALKLRRDQAGKQSRTMDLNNLCDETILVEFQHRKERNLIPAEDLRAIQLLLDSKLVASAINLIKSQVLATQEV